MARGLKLIVLAALCTGACNMADRTESERGGRRDGEAARNRSERAIDNRAERNKSAEAEPLVLEQGQGGQLASATPRESGGLSRDWFAGSWTDTGDCADAGAFNRDGRYRLADGTRGMWNVRGRRLIVQNAQGRNEVQLRRTGDNTIEIVNEDGSVGRSTRC
jgi:hypothetical protein